MCLCKEWDKQEHGIGCVCVCTVYGVRVECGVYGVYVVYIVYDVCMYMCVIYMYVVYIVW